MDEDSIRKLDKETLEFISYNRSKKWAAFFEAVEANAKDDEVIDLNDIENQYNDENEDNMHYSLEDMAEEALDEEEENSNNMNAMYLVENLKVSNAHGILAQINKRANETGILDSEVQRVLEKTLPIVEEHKREFREAGFERVLNSFNLVKIEEKVGSWMRRNNSIVYRAITMSPNDIYETHGTQSKQCDNDTDSSDSLHSVDTARYVRACRKRLDVQKRIATTTTTIRSYRFVESKRNELHRKYAYLANDDTMHILNPASFRPRDVNYRACPENMNFCRKVDMRLCQKSRRIQRRHYRKRINSPYSSYSSSEDDDYTCRQNLLKTKCCSSGRRQMHDKNYEKNDYLLPYRRETECSCREADKLCNNARHLANSSSEDWLVENLESPKKTVNEDEEKIIKKNKRSCEEASCSDNIKLTKIDSNAKMVAEKKSSNNKALNKNNVKETSIKSKNDIQEENETEDSFEYYLQEAIRLSKEQYEQDLKAQFKKTSSKADSLVKDDYSHPSSVLEKPNNSRTKSITKNKLKIPTEKNNSKANSRINQTSENEILDNDSSAKPKAKKEVKAQTKSKLAKIENVEVIQTSGHDKSITPSYKKLTSKEEVKTKTEKNCRELNSKSIQTCKHEKSNNLSPSNPNPKKKAETKNEHEKNSLKKDGNGEVNSIKIYGNDISNTQSSTKSSTKTELKAKPGKQNTRQPNDFKSNEISKTNEKSTSISSSSTSSSAKGIQNIAKKNRKNRRFLESIIELCSDNSDSCEVADKNNIGSRLQNEIQYLNTVNENSTFFATSGKIYNSTVLENNAATFRNIRISGSTNTATGLNSLKNNTISEGNETTIITAVTKPVQVIHTNTEIVNNKNTQESNTIPSRANTRLLQENHIMSTENNDCSVISSTTDSDLQLKAMVMNTQKKPTDRIMLYTPNNRSLLPENSFINGKVRITEDHLASFIGNAKASKFIKYYHGPMEFKQSSTIYYKPPNEDEENCSSDSDVEWWDLAFKYGQLHESKGTLE